MGKPVASTIASLFAVSVLPLSLSGPVLAQDDDIEALKAKVASLQNTVDNTMQGREYLYNELNAAIARAEAAEAERNELQAQHADLTKSLRFMTNTRDHLYAEMEAAEQQSARRLEVAETGQNYMTDRLSAVLDEKAASEAALKKEIEQAIIGRDYLAERLEREVAESAALAQNYERRLEVADNGQAFMTDRLSQVLDEKAETETSLQKQLDSATTGRNYLSERLKAALAEKASLSAELDKMTTGRNFLLERARDVLADSKAKDDQLDQLAEVSFAQINSAIAERDAARTRVAELEQEIEDVSEVAFAQINSAIDERNAAREEVAAASAASTAVNNEWAVARSNQLSSAFANIAGTQVTASEDNTVTIQVGNSGLFNSGGTVLSENGQNVLLQLGDVLAEFNDAHINVIGHTDDRPVGSDSRFASNAELSFARASSALRYLNRNAGVSADNLTASGLGARYPIATNDTADGRTANRRVELVLSQK
jgi:chemotaxis protein MotB